MDQYEKIYFQLSQDEDGWPPFSVESVWAEPGVNPDEYIIDNIPFFIREATLGDTVRVREQDAQRWFEEVVRPSTHSLIRIIYFDPAQAGRITARLVELGCSTEGMPSFKLLAVSIPPEVKLSEVQAYLGSERDAGVLEYEEPILWQEVDADVGDPRA